MGSENILRCHIAETERFNQFIQKAAFFFRRHTAYFFDDFFLAPKIEAEEKKKYQEKNTEKQIHNKVLIYRFVISYD